MQNPKAKHNSKRQLEYIKQHINNKKTFNKNTYKLMKIQRIYIIVTANNDQMQK